MDGTMKNAKWKGMFHDSEKLIRGIIYLNIGMFALSLFLNTKLIGLSFNPFASLAPDSKSLLVLGATGTYPIDKLHRWWSLLSANYLHGGILHILFNMIAFSQIAPAVAREYGRHRFLIIYSLGGIVGFYISYLAGVIFTIGASAAVCSLLGALLYYGWNRGGEYGNLVFKQVGGWILSLFVFGFLWPGINNWGHGGGILSGAVLGLLMGYSERKSENSLHRYFALGLTIATLMILTWAVITGIFFRLTQ
jgi:rhomboid protease GluP